MTINEGQGASQSASQEMETAQQVSNRSEARRDVEALKDELLQVSACVETHKDQIAKMLIGVEEAMVSDLVDVPNISDWMDDELRDIEDRVERLEGMETRVWELLARYAGDESRLTRAKNWR